MPLDHEAPPRLRQYGRRNRSRKSGPSSVNPINLRRSARLQQQHNRSIVSSDSNSTATGLSKLRTFSSSLYLQPNGKHITSHAQEIQELQRKIEKTLDEFAAFKDAQKERFSCPICLHLAINPRV
ncbi:hypothetical protein BT96DRAFT_991852 [Gymnopus androsaceus JB14]|uniref:Uncharacterized protein n=1 Tax=Gymnopus androsaceus JB14 TaxID=1447944 RepID=A0A6A4HWT1_9AGAR|nr:hypothetical protein BT96DRAFT_991852 [Gymnopus androsaceus JB14]